MSHYQSKLCAITREIPKMTRTISTSFHGLLLDPPKKSWGNLMTMPVFFPPTTRHEVCHVWNPRQTRWFFRRRKPALPHFIPKTLVVGHVDNHLKRSQISRTPSQNGHLHNCQDIRSFWLLLGNVPGIVLKFSLEDINSGWSLGIYWILE